MTDRNGSDTDAHHQHMHKQHMHKVWGSPSGWAALSAVNHTTVGLRFVATGMVFFLIGGLLAMLMRTQLALPEQNIIGPQLYNQIFTMHGTVMMFLFAIPVLEGLSMYLIPKMIGARDLLFPRVSAFGYYCYLFGGVIILSSLVLGMAPATGWFMYTPLSDANYAPGPGSDFWLLGITFVEISAVAAGVELVVSILFSRANGMSLRNMPIFCWYILAMGLMIIFGFPPLILASILLELERTAGMVFFEVSRGGDPLLWQHLFWLFGHPEVYILFLPAAGIVSTLIPVFSNRPLVGYRWVVLSIGLIAFISFGLWAHHMFTVGIPRLALAFFSVASMLIAIPTGVQLFSWLATLWSGRVVYNLPMLWIVGFLVIFVCGGLTGVMLALVPFNWQVHDTYFVVAHMHYVLVGGMLFPLMAGFYYWLPHLSGRMPTERLGRWGFWLTFVGFNTTFLLMHVTGLMGMPRRVYTYQAGVGWDWLNLMSSVGGFIMAAGVAMIIMDIALHFRFGRRAQANPWHADTLEWAMSMPPPSYNFASLPTVNTRHPLWDNPELPDSIAAGEHALSAITHGRRETYGTDAITGRIREIIHLPGNSWLPLQAAFALAIVCIALLMRAYPVALLAAVAALYLLLRWSWHNGGHPQALPLVDDEPVDPPLHSRTRRGPGLWGMVTTLLADGTLYLSLLFGWFYLWAAAPQWVVPELRAFSMLPFPQTGDAQPIALLLLLASGVLLTLAVAWYVRGLARLRKGNAERLQGCLLGVAGLGMLHFLLLLWAMLSARLKPAEQAYDSVLSVMLIYLLLHSALAVVLTAMQARRVALGYVSRELPYEPEVLRPLWIFTLGIFWSAFAAFVLLPLAWGSSV